MSICKNMDIYKDNGVLLMKSDLIKYFPEVINVGDDSSKNIFNAVYNDISEVFGVDVALQLYQMYKGIFYQVNYTKHSNGTNYIHLIQVLFENTNQDHLR